MWNSPLKRGDEREIKGKGDRGKRIFSLNPLYG
jgi:hypothetical protein